MTVPVLRTGADVPSLETRLQRERSALRVRAVAALALAVIGLGALSLSAGAWLMADGRWMLLPRFMPLTVWLAAAAAAVLLVWSLRKRSADVLNLDALATAVEREQQLRAGSLRGALEVGGAGVLGARASQDVARKLSSSALAPKMALRLARGMTISGIVAVVTLGALTWSAGRVPDGFAAAVHPVRAWRGTLLPALGFEKVPTLVPRGMPITMGILAEGRQEIHVSHRADGEAWRDTTLTVPRNGIVSLALGPVRTPVSLRVRDGRAPEAKAIITVADRGWIGDVALFAEYPAYLSRENETLEPVPPLRVPRGTRVRVHAVLRGGARMAMLTDGRDTVRFIGNDGEGAPVQAIVSLNQDGTWRWLASATSRDGGEVLPPELPDAITFTVAPDRAPEVMILSPAVDTAIGPTGIVPVYVRAGDDHGVGAVSLEIRREAAGQSHRGGARERIEVASPLSPVFEGGTSIVLDPRALQPGDKLYVTAVAIDDSPWRQRAVSNEVILRMPSLAEQRAMARDLADSLAARAAQLAKQEQRLQQNTADASRSRDLNGSGRADASQPNSAKSDGNTSAQMSFAAAEKARQLSRDQQQLGARVDSLRQSARELETRLKNANALDTALASRMQEIQRLLREAMSPEIQKQLEALNKSTERLSGTEARRSMQQLAEQQQQMRQQLERSAEMLQRAALEGAMQTLRDDATELAKEQQQLADRHAGKSGIGRPSSSPTELADRSRDLERNVQKLTKRLDEAGAKPGASQTRAAEPLVNEAADAMQREAQKPGARRESTEVAAAEKQGDQQTSGTTADKQSNGGAQKQGEKAAGGDAEGKQAGGEQAGQQKGQQVGPQAGKRPDGSSQSGAQSGSQGEARKAAEAMAQAAQRLADARESQVQAWKGELSQQLDQSINETMQLARQQAELEKRARQQGAQSMQGEQNALQQGVEQAAERLEKAGRSSSLLSQRSQRAMGEAQKRVAQASKSAQGAGQPGGNEQAQNAMKDATEALNQALSSLVRDRERVNGAQSASGFTEMMEQLRQLAQQQGQLNGQMQGLNLLPGGPQGAAAQQQARALARQQREVAKSLSDVSDADQTGRTDALAKEAQLLAQQLERGGLDPSVAARQQQLYRRLLDAGRFLEKDERDDQGPREARAGNGSGAGARDGLQSGRAANKFTPPSWNELRGLDPDERRLVIEYFRRLNGAAPQ